MWGYIGSIAVGATILGLILGIFSIYNGRVTRRHTENLIKEIREHTERLIEGLSKQHETMIKQLNRSSEQHDTMIKQHDAIIEILKTPPIQRKEQKTEADA